MNRTPFRSITALGVAVLLTLASCGGDDDESGTNETTATQAAADAGGESAPASASITIASFAFSGDTEVAVGTTVVVTNNDGSPHTWSSDDGAFDSGTLDPGDSFEFTVTEAGAFAYHCNFHPSMTGTITVTG